MKWRRTIRLVLTIGVLVALAIPLSSVLADGTETLGEPTIAIANGSGHVAAGTGLIDQPATIDIAVPDGSLVNQVLLYWEGHGDCDRLPLGDIGECRLGEDLTINGNNLTGQLIGGPTHFYTLPPGMHSLSYRADITDLNLVSAGNNSLSISGVSFDATSATLGVSPGFANGASVVVIYDDGTTAEVGVRDGDDNAFINFAAPLDSTVPQTFNFDPESSPRTADLSLLVGSVKSTEYPPGGERPNRIVVTVGGIVTNYDNLFGSTDGPIWDTLTLPIDIPAGASSLTVEVQSHDDGSGNLPASLSWVSAIFSVPVTPDSGAGAGTPGYWMNHPDAWPVDEVTIGGVVYSKEDAIKIIKAPSRGDKSLDMFAHLVAAKLNVLVGADSTCVDGTIADADAWMATNGPAGSNVRARSDAWDVGEPLKDTLDDYNNGRLCAPSRD